MDRSFNEKKSFIMNNGGFYLPQIPFETVRLPTLWSYVLSEIEHYDDIIFEYKEDAARFDSFVYKLMKKVFIEMGYLDKINTSLVWRYNEDMPVGTMFIYERKKLKIMLEIQPIDQL